MVFEAIFSGMILCSAPSWRTGIKSRMGTERSALPLLAQRGFIQRYNSFFLFRALNFYRKWRRVGHHGPPSPNACLWSLKFVKITVTWHDHRESTGNDENFLSYVSGGIQKWEPWLSGWSHEDVVSRINLRLCIIRKVITVRSKLIRALLVSLSQATWRW